MGKSVRVFVVGVLVVLGTAALTFVAALMAAVSLAATALIVPGTGTPNANVVSNYRENALDRYIAPFDPFCTNAMNCDLVGINYPATFFPFIIFPGWCEPGPGRCQKWDDSVGAGVDSLYTALQNLPEEDGPAVLFGYSQGGAVVSNTLRRLQQGDPSITKVSSVVLIGNAYNPDGGLFTRFGFLPTLPFFDVTFGPATPVDTGVPITSIGFEYDPVVYAPLYFGNPLAVLNAFAAFENVHGFYLTPDGRGPNDPIAYDYTDAELAAILATDCPGDFCRVDSYGNEYYMIPAKSLPIFDLILSNVPDPAKPFVTPIVDLVAPATKVLIDLGYDFSGDPGQTRYLSPLPFNPIQNPFQVGLDLVEAVGEGIENATGGLTTTLAPVATDPPVNSSVPQVLSTTSPTTTPSASPATDSAESQSAGAAGTSSTATDAGELTPAETEAPGARRRSGNLFRPATVSADASSSGAESRPPTTARNSGTTSSGAPSSATGGAGSTAGAGDAAA